MSRDDRRKRENKKRWVYFRQKEKGKSSYQKGLRKEFLGNGKRCKGIFLRNRGRLIEG